MNIIITGGAKGIGKEAVENLKANYNVIVIDNDAEALENLNGVEKHVLDVTNREKVFRTVKGLNTHIVVNCAGVQKQGSVEDMIIEDFEEHIYHNYIGTINVIQACLPDLRKNNGKIVNVSSIAGKIGLPLLSGYCGSKFAVEGFTDSLRRELKDIDVVLVEPGRVKTGFNEKGRDNLEKYEESAYSDLYQEKLDNKVKGLDPEKAGYELARIILYGNKPRYTITSEAGVISKLERLLPDRVIDYLFKEYRY